MSTSRLTDAQHLAMLKVVRRRISDDIPLEAVDDDFPGDKHTEANWGQCTQKGWPKDARLFKNRDSPKHRETRQRCPMDTRERPTIRGCFYTCRIFQGPIPTKEEALELYDIRIRQAED